MGLLLAMAGRLWAADPEENAGSGFEAPLGAAYSNTVFVVLGPQDKVHGLRHLSQQKDGLTTPQTIDGGEARLARVDPQSARPALYFYFQIHPEFKQQDLSWARIDVEYYDRQPGTLGIQYDAFDADRVSKPQYREANSQVTLPGSRSWKKASFRTRGDGAFSGRQNGRADFRIWARTGEILIRRVSVTHESSPDEQWTAGYGQTNQVSIVLGRDETELAGGIRHIPDVSGRTTMELMDGVPCRYLNRVQEGRMLGSIYFTLSPGFKQNGSMNARVEIEYLAKKDTSIRLQFDGMDGDVHRMYQPVLPEGAPVFRFGNGADYGLVRTPGVWSVATFQVTNAVFQNSQREGADFRLEVVPPEIHVRRVTVTRMR